MGAKLELKGKKFGRLTVVEEVGRDVWGKVLYKCKCDCGSSLVAKSSCIYKSRVKSCGCMRIEKITKHEMSGTTEYVIWGGMIQRCNNPNDSAYKFYGDRGITVCDRWLKFENFFKDMGKRPKGLTLERKNNNLGYFKNNCCWETRKNQSRNTRVYKTNLLGIKGVCWDNKRKRYRARISINQTDIHLGRFIFLKEAVKARKQAEQRYWGESKC